MQRIIILITFLFLIAGLNSCNSGFRKNGDAIVSASILPLEYFIDRLTGGSLDVNVMVPPGASHATYSPTTVQFKKLSDSGIYFRIGYLGYEQAWIGRLQEINPDMLVVNLSEGLELIRGEETDHGDHVHEGGIDPHIWMSPAVMLNMLPTIKNAIIEVYPSMEEEVSRNYDALYGDIALLDAEMKDLTASLTQKRFMIFHPALTYLARDYGLEQIAVEHGGKEPSPAMLSHIIREARQQEIPVIFIQQEFDLRSAQLISHETGAALVQINPLDYEWQKSMEELMQVFKTYLQ
jgi:zinc transport system substrate-binding protein